MYLRCRYSFIRVTVTRGTPETGSRPSPVAPGARTLPSLPLDKYPGALGSPWCDVRRTHPSKKCNRSPIKVHLDKLRDLVKELTFSHFPFSMRKG